MERTILLALSREELVAIILAQAKQIDAFLQCRANLEAQLNAPPETVYRHH